jgi:RNA recognition motif-containing protein
LKNTYVGNISCQTTEPDLDAAFSAFGQVDRVQMVKDRETGQSRGFAFVEMQNNAEADRADGGSQRTPTSVNGRIFIGAVDDDDLTPGLAGLER